MAIENFPLDLEELGGAFDYLNDGVYITDCERRIVLWNRMAVEITGYSREEVIGRACRDSLLNHTDKEGRPLCSTDLCPLYRAMTSNAVAAPVEIIYALTAHRGRIPLSVSVAPLHDREGRVIGGVEIFRDESERLRDLEFARRIQQSLLLNESGRFHSLDISVIYAPRDHVGGDYYEIIELAPELAAIFVADVRGHGVSAALYTAMLKTIVQSLRHLARQPSAFLEEANETLARLALDEVFATALCLIVDGKGGRVKLANAGHPPPLVRKTAGAVQALDSGDMALGFSATTHYPTAAVTLDPGDAILAYTDGASECADLAGKPLGLDGLAALVAKTDFSSAQAAVEELRRSLHDYAGGARLADDLILLACVRRPW